jgi:hypothetical protein
MGQEKEHDEQKAIEEMRVLCAKMLAEFDRLRLAEQAAVAASSGREKRLRSRDAKRHRRKKIHEME